MNLSKFFKIVVLTSTNISSIEVLNSKNLPGNLIININNYQSQANPQNAGIDLKQFQPFKLYEESAKKIDALLESAKKHKIKIVFSITGSLYAGSFYKIMIENKFVALNNGWSSWKSNITFEKFLEISQSDLYKELVEDLNKKYADSKNNLVERLVIFIQSVEDEIQRLNRYIYLIDYIKFLKLQRLYPIKDELYFKAKEKIQKLTYLKNILYNGVSTTKRLDLKRQIQPKFMRILRLGFAPNKKINNPLVLTTSTHKFAQD